MSDPRNVAHDKKVKQEKEHQEPRAGAGKQKKARKKAASGADQSQPTENTATVTEVPKAEPADLEKSTAVLSKLKEMEFHARANIETLAGLILTIEDELKQKEFSEPIGALYAAQDGFRTQIAALIEQYEAKCESLKPSA